MHPQPALPLVVLADDARAVTTHAVAGEQMNVWPVPLQLALFEFEIEPPHQPRDFLTRSPHKTLVADTLVLAVS